MFADVYFQCIDVFQPIHLCFTIVLHLQTILYNLNVNVAKPSPGQVPTFLCFFLVYDTDIDFSSCLSMSLMTGYVKFDVRHIILLVITYQTQKTLYIAFQQ